MQQLRSLLLRNQEIHTFNLKFVISQKTLFNAQNWQHTIT
jgi:hypothetical protein